MLAERAARVGLQLREQVFEVAAQAAHEGVVERAPVVAVLDLQRRADLDLQVYRVAGEPFRRHLAEAQPVVLVAAQCRVDRVVLEHHDAVEQRPPGAAEPALDVGERGVLVLAQVGGLQRAQVLAHRLRRAARHRHRQGVDEQPQHLLRARQRGRAAGERGTVERREFGLPERLGDGGVLAREPAHVLAVARPRRRQRLAAVVAQPVADQHRVAPAVEQNVVLGPDELVTVVVEVDQAQPRQRRRGEVELAPQLGRDVGGEARVDVVEAAPVEPRDRRPGPSPDELQRARQPALPEETGTQHRVALDHRLPRAHQPLRVEPPHLDAQLAHVQARARRLQRVKQHALLRRREREDVLDRALVECERRELFRLQEILQPAARGRGRRRGGVATHHHGGELGHARALEHLPRRHLPAGVAQPRDDLQAQDRVAAEFEEVVMATDAGAAEHRGPGRRQHGFDLALRRLPGGGDVLGRGQRLARSTLPLAFSGSASSSIHAAGTM